jgi:putative redox protein
MDVISILRKKRQVVSRYEVRASGEQQEAHPNAFSRIDIVHVFEGEAINVEAVRRAIELSATKYCAVGATLSSGMTEIHHAYLVRDRDDEERMSEVIVTGPLEAADAPGTRLAGAAALAA